MITYKDQCDTVLMSRERVFAIQWRQYLVVSVSSLAHASLARLQLQRLGNVHLVLQIRAASGK